MSWLFGKKKNTLKIDSESRKYVEECILWFLRHAYDPDTFQFKLHLPREDEFPEFSSDPKSNLIQLVAQVSKIIGLKETVSISVFNSKTLEWETWSQENSNEGKAAPVLQIREETLQYKAHLISAIALDLSAIKLDHLYDNTNRPGSEVELYASFHGLLVILLCAYEKVNAGFISGPRLEPTLHLYAASLLCRLFNTDHTVCKIYLDVDAYDFLNHYINDHAKSDKFLEYKVQCQKLINLAPVYKTAYCGQYYLPEVGEAFTKLLAEEKSAVNFNNRGYHYLLNGKHKEALADFNSAIDIDPYFAYAFNNRAYSRMFTGDMSGAWNDLVSTEYFDPENSQAFRNKGIYFLLEQKPEEALQQLLIALEKDKNTEHIYFWIGKAHFAMGNHDEAKKYFQISRNLPELPIPDYPI